MVSHSSAAAALLVASIASSAMPIARGFAPPPQHLPPAGAAVHRSSSSSVAIRAAESSSSSTTASTDLLSTTPVDEECALDTENGNVPALGDTEKERLLYEALGKFVPMDELGGYRFEPTSGGVNNVVYYVKKREEEGKESLLGVLRVYNNSNDDPKVAFEHGILERLSSRTLSFGIPETMMSNDGNRFEKLDGGASACLFKSIPGVLPKLSKVRESYRARCRR